MSKLTPKPFYHRSLPHIIPPGATFFVTFRLAGSIAAEVLAALRDETAHIRAELERLPASPERAERLYQEEQRLFGKWDAYLDQGQGPVWLRNPEIASLVADALRFFDKQRYDLLAYCIMSNHVHVVLTPLPQNNDTYYPLAGIMHTIKGFTARRANQILGRTGEFWLHESYDHFVRAEPELRRIIAYVMNNPVKAGLVEDWPAWPWTYVCDAHLQAQAQAGGL